MQPPAPVVITANVTVISNRDSSLETPAWGIDDIVDEECERGKLREKNVRGGRAAMYELVRLGM